MASDDAPKHYSDYDWRKRIQRARRNTFRAVITILGAIVAAPTLISMIQQILQVGLTWHFAEFVSFYRKLFAPIIDFIQWPLRTVLQWLQFDFAIPQWLKDLQILSFIGAGIGARSEMLVCRDYERDVIPYFDFDQKPTEVIRDIFEFIRELLPDLHEVSAFFEDAVKTIVSGFTLFGLYFICLQPWIGGPFEEERRAARSTIGALILAVLAFYVGNAVAVEVGLD